MPKPKRDSQPRLRYGIVYWFDGRKWTDPNAHGASEHLINACGNAARHVSRAEFSASEYRKAIIFDRWTGKMVKSYSRTADGISIKDY